MKLYAACELIAPIGKALGFFPLVRIFTAQDLLESLTDAGLKIDYQWQPSKDKAIFIVANGILQLFQFDRIFYLIASHKDNIVGNSLKEITYFSPILRFKILIAAS